MSGGVPPLGAQVGLCGHQMGEDAQHVVLQIAGRHDLVRLPRIVVGLRVVVPVPSQQGQLGQCQLGGRAAVLPPQQRGLLEVFARVIG